jgi:hypothetical protein
LYGLPTIVRSPRSFVTITAPEVPKLEPTTDSRAPRVDAPDGVGLFCSVGVGSRTSYEYTYGGESCPATVTDRFPRDMGDSVRQLMLLLVPVEESTHSGTQETVAVSFVMDTRGMPEPRHARLGHGCEVYDDAAHSGTARVLVAAERHALQARPRLVPEIFSTMDSFFRPDTRTRPVT